MIGGYGGSKTVEEVLATHILDISGVPCSLLYRNNDTSSTKLIFEGFLSKCTVTVIFLLNGTVVTDKYNVNTFFS